VAKLRNCKNFFQIKSSKLFGGCGLALFGYTIGYPYTREIYHCFFKIDETDGFTVYKINRTFKKLNEDNDSHPLLQKYLSERVKDMLKYKKTKLGGTLYHIIKSDSDTGFVAADSQSYKTFAPIFDKVIDNYHAFGPTECHPPVDYGEDHLVQFPDLDPERKFILSTKIQCRRSLAGYPFNPLLIEDDYLTIEEKVRRALNQFSTEPELKGKYYRFRGMNKAIHQKLTNDCLINYKNQNNRLLRSSAKDYYWPNGRGIYYNDNKTLVVLVNNEDHVCLSSKQDGGNVGEVFARITNALKIMERKLKFNRDHRLGWLNFSPANLGTAIQASVEIKLPNIGENPDFHNICDGLNLRILGTRQDTINGRTPENVQAVYEISNKACLGLTEFEAIKQMHNGIKQLIEIEISEKGNRNN